MKQKRDKVIKGILISLLAISIVWSLIFHLSYTGSEILWAITSNPILRELRHIYWSCFPSLISVIVAFANVIYSGMELHSSYKAQGTKKTPSVIYLIISLGALLLHLITHDYVFSALVAG